MKIITEQDIIKENSGKIVQVLELRIGDAVQKHSGKPFKHGDKFDVIIGFGFNNQAPVKETAPLNNVCAILEYSNTKVNVFMLEKYSGKTELKVQFDEFGHPPTTPHLELKYDENYMKYTINLVRGEEQVSLFEADLDQWGIWFHTNGQTIAHEDDTRFFLDAYIKTLQRLRNEINWNAKDATVMED